MSKHTRSCQLCWACAKATNGGCSWAKEFRPIKGWDAQLEIIQGILSYKIEECPEFENDNACNTCRHIKGEEHCVGCTYLHETGRNTKIKWEGVNMYVRHE